MRRLAWVVAFLVVALAFPVGVFAAQETSGDEGFVFRGSGDVVVGANEVMGAVIVADGDALIKGEVTDALVVFSGTATVTGTVSGDIVIFSGDLALGETASVNNVTMFQSNLDRAEGAVIAGELTEQSDLLGFGWGAFVFSAMMWIGLTLVLLAAASLFAWYGGRQLSAVGTVARQRPAPAILALLVLLFGLPVVAVLAFATVIGIPLGLAIFMIVIPALWVIGYLVVGAQVGGWLLRLLNTDHRVLAAAIGVVLFQLISLIPAFGPLVAFLAGLYGAGAFIYWLVGQPGSHRAAPLPQSQSRPAV